MTTLKKYYISLVNIINPPKLKVSYKKVDDIKTIKEAYDDVETVAERYDTSDKNENISIVKDPAIRESIYFLEEKCKSYSKEFKKIKRVLDIGCGNGVYSQVFRQRNIFSDNIKYFGSEINKRFVEICKKRFPNETFFISKADNINFKNKTFDLVYCSSTLHYTLNKWKESIDEMSRLTKKYIVLVRFPVTKFNKTFYVQQSVSHLGGIENHYFIVINNNDLENYMKKIGLSILKSDYSTEEYNIEGINENIFLSQYLLTIKY